MRTLTEAEQSELIKMYEKVENDFKAFPFIQTTEDLFRSG